MYRKDWKNEHYTLKAHKEGYPARSVYKLKEIDETYNLVEKGNAVLDLGCSPGSWLIYLSEKVGPAGKVIGVDTAELKIPRLKNVIFLQKDVADLEISELKKFAASYQAVVSDLSPSTSGIPGLDNARSLELAEKALEIALAILAPGGNFLVKLFEGEGREDFFGKVKKSFKTARIVRPKAVFRRSREVYVVAKGLKMTNGKW